MRLVGGTELGKLLVETEVPVLVLNACRSAHAQPPARPDKEADAAPDAGDADAQNAPATPPPQGRAPGTRAHAGPDAGAHPFQLDSKKPTLALAEFEMAETRFSMLARSEPDRAQLLLGLAQADVDERWRYYEQLAAVSRVVPQARAAAGGTEPEESK